MELSSIELQSFSSNGTTLTIVGDTSQEDIKQFNKQNDKITVSSDNTVDTVETTSTAAIISTTGTTDNATITDDSGSMTCPTKKFSSHICLGFIILFVIAVILIPAILYYTTSPQDPSFFDNVDFQSCSVSTWI